MSHSANREIQTCTGEGWVAAYRVCERLFGSTVTCLTGFFNTLSTATATLPAILRADNRRRVFVLHEHLDRIVFHAATDKTEKQPVIGLRAQRKVEPGWIYAFAVAKGANVSIVGARRFCLAWRVESIGTNLVGARLRMHAALIRPVAQQSCRLPPR
jgi:hypothetical protein